MNFHGCLIFCMLLMSSKFGAVQNVHSANIVVSKYSINLEPVSEDSEIKGHISILVEVSRAFNVSDLTDKYCSEWTLSNIQFHKISDSTIIKCIILMNCLIICKNHVRPGKYAVSMEFEDLHSHRNNRITYGSDGNRWDIYTAIQPSLVPLFPVLFDNQKATVSLTIAHKPDQIAVSITDRVIPKSNKTSTQFKETPAISPELLSFALINTPYTHISDPILTIQSKYSGDRDFILPKVGKIQNIFKDLFGEKFNEQFPHLHFITVPDTLDIDPVNLRIIPFKESEFFCKANTWSTEMYRDNLITLIQKLGRQWFNNLVISSPPKYTWMNEGFSELYANNVYNLVEVNSSAVESYLSNSFQSALRNDSSLNAEAVNVASYSRETAIIRMLSHVLGEPQFNATVQKFVVQNAYKNVSFEDFLQEVQKVCEYLPCGGAPIVPLKDYILTWINSKGFPLLTIKRNYVNSTMTITQETFVEDRRNMYSDDYTIRSVPVNYAIQSTSDFQNTSTLFWFVNQKVTRDLESKASEWVIFNKKATGFYRVNYDLNNWDMIIKHLRNDKITSIHVLNRAQLIDDAFSLAYGSYLNYSVAISLSSYLVRETEYAPWISAINAMMILDTKLKGTPIHETFQTYFKTLLRPMEEKLKYEESAEDSENEKVLRNQILLASCRMGSENCVRRAEKYLFDYYDSPDPDLHKLSPNLKTWIYCEGLQRSNLSVWNFMYERTINSDMGSEKNLLFQSLKCTESENLFERYLHKLLLRKEKIIFEETFSVGLFNVNMTYVAIKFLINNQAEVEKTFNTKVIEYIKNIGKSFNKMAQYNKLEEFLLSQSESFESDIKVLKSMKTEVENHVQWYETYGKTILESMNQESTRMPYTNKPKEEAKAENNSPKIGNSLQIIVALLALLIFIN